MTKYNWGCKMYAMQELFTKNAKEYSNKIGLSQYACVEKSSLHRTYISELKCEKHSLG